MGSHIADGQFQSDKYPSCPPDKVPLSVKDKTAQDLLWEYAQRRRSVDAEFSDDLAGYVPTQKMFVAIAPLNTPPVQRTSECVKIKDQLPDGWTAVVLPHGWSVAKDVSALLGEVVHTVTDARERPRLVGSAADEEHARLSALCADPTGGTVGDIRDGLRWALDVITVARETERVMREALDDAERKHFDIMQERDRLLRQCHALHLQLGNALALADDEPENAATLRDARLVHKAQRDGSLIQLLDLWCTDDGWRRNTLDDTPTTSGSWGWGTSPDQIDGREDTREAAILAARSEADVGSDVYVWPCVHDVDPAQYVPDADDVIDRMWQAAYHDRPECIADDTWPDVTSVEKAELDALLVPVRAWAKRTCTGWWLTDSKPEVVRGCEMIESENSALSE